MQKLLLSILAISLVTPMNAFVLSNPPKREFRGAWIATVINLDWPSAPGLDPATQRGELRRLLDELQAAGINAVIFQVRSECDAMYASTMEPWSFWLTGGQGRPPSPFYDPLEFAVQEAHQRGMELHAWFNPYRAVREIGVYANDSNHVSVKHSDWIMQAGNHKILDPGLPAVRAYVTRVVMDVVNRYDVDGVHFDDYFYPYPPDQITTQDNATFASYSRGFTNRGDWRRDNINLLVKMVHDSIQVAKPYVKFGISPFGIWRNGVPAGISGLDAYSTIYCDAIAWLQQQTVDYLTPQLYWPFGGGQDYGKLMPWWASQVNGRHLYPGQAAYRISGWAANEMPRQIRLNRNTGTVGGSVFFRALFFRDNPKGFVDTLKSDLYHYPALSPVMAWKDGVAPNAPQNLRYERLAGTGTMALKWDVPFRASDGDTASRYVLYRFDHPAVQPQELDDASKIVAIAGPSFSMPKPPASPGPHYYVVTALDRNANESLPSPAVMVLPPETPMLASPGSGAIVATASVPLIWNYPANAASYQLQVSLDSTFATQLLTNETGIIDTFKVIAGLAGQTTYYWRVKASNAGGASAFSRLENFTTGFPATVMLVTPSNNMRDLSVRPTMAWRTALGANSYHLQIASTSLFDSVSLAFDVEGIVDTSHQISQLEGDRFYFWRVRAGNAIGASNWSTVWRFKTAVVTAVAEANAPPGKFELYQNYPNPFSPHRRGGIFDNSITTIVFDLPNPGTPQLVIYDALGREMFALINAPMAAGRHQVQFDASSLSSGVYYYRLRFEGKVLTKRMTVVK